MNEQEQVELLTGRMATLTEHFNMIRDNVKKMEQEQPVIRLRARSAFKRTADISTS